MTIQQAIASRRKARRDDRYKGLKSGDVTIQARKAQEKLLRERERQQRYGQKKKTA